MLKLLKKVLVNSPASNDKKHINSNKSANIDIVLDVPFAEKDEAKKLGAKWNPKLKKWYMSKHLDKNLFDKWLPENKKKNNLSNIILNSPVYLIKSSEKCYKCHAISNVFCLASNNFINIEYDEIGKKEIFIDDFATFSNLSVINKELKNILNIKTPNYKMAYTKQSNSYYYVNHCSCGAKLGDFYMHNEPNGAFFPTSEEEAKNIIKYHITELKKIEISAYPSVSCPNYIKDYSKHNVIDNLE